MLESWKNLENTRTYKGVFQVIFLNSFDLSETLVMEFSNPWSELS